MSNGFCYKALLIAIVATLTGCASIPERELENAFKYQRLKQSDMVGATPIPSEYQDYADKAYENQSVGKMEQYVSILEVGDDALLARVHLIRSARKTVDLQTFIWKDDPTCRFVFDELVKAAERGVLVRVLIDALNKPASAEQLAKMAHAHRNLEICLYKPLSELVNETSFGFWDNVIFKTRHMNRRMHNKLLLIDGRIGIVGGRNYQGKYYDRDKSFLFRDRDIVVAGPAVEDMQEAFELFWQDKHAVFVTQFIDVQQAFELLPDDLTGAFLAPEEAGAFEEIDRLASQFSLAAARETLKVYEADRVEFVSDTPGKFTGKESEGSFDEWFEAMGDLAEDRLVYQTPYLIYDRATRKGFQEQYKKNKNFRIIASSNSLAAADHLHVYAISFKHRKQLYKKSGIDIYESKPYPADRASYIYNYAALKEDEKEPRLCIHSKSFVIDGKIAMIGSHNFDPRSAKLNTECGLFIADDEVGQRIEQSILNACEPQNAWTVSKAPTTPVISYFSGIIGAISTAIPFFDVWPYRYTTNYELNDGAEILSPRDPTFMDNYTDVGYFPEVNDSGAALKTQLMKAFGGWARPLM